MKIDFIASEQHFCSHLKPIWDNLPIDIKGNFYIRSNLKLDIPYLYKKPFSTTSVLVRKLQERDSNNFILGAGYGEVSKLKQHPFPMILTEHGAGQKYLSDHPSYSSGKGFKHNVYLFLSPNDFNATGHKENYPNTPVEIIGCPKLDQWIFTPKPKNDIPVVCISFHWDCHIVPETRSTWDYYKDSLNELISAKEFKLIGHAHPRIFKKVKKVYDELGIEIYENFDDVINLADVYVCDNSSTIFEFAALDRPVVILNAPFYRRSVEHGLRFWEYSDIGFNCNEPSELYETILKTINQDELKANRRKEIVEKIYPYKGYASQIAVGKLLSFIKNFPYTPLELEKDLKRRLYNYRHSINHLYTRKGQDYMQYIKKSNQKIHDLKRRERL